jgi:predicted DNA-binding transcriptional regulator AlpA
VDTAYTNLEKLRQQAANAELRSVLLKRDHFSVEEFCVVLGISRKTFYSYIDQGKIRKATQWIDGRVAWDRDSVLSAMQLIGA